MVNQECCTCGGTPGGGEQELRGGAETAGDTLEEGGSGGGGEGTTGEVGYGTGDGGADVVAGGWCEVHVGRWWRRGRDVGGDEEGVG